MQIINNDIVVNKAKENGFNLVGFAKAAILEDEIKKLKEWLRNGYNAGMAYMERNEDKREDLKNVLSNAKSIISLGLNYYTPHVYTHQKKTGKVSRYAWGKDYHLIIWDKLFELESQLKTLDNNFESISYVDTGPVMDKVWAVKAGLGWMGKHTNVINKDFGSWFFIANIITNYEFDYSEEIPDFCGECTACIDACPTDAIVKNYVVDSNKCISYLTIENKNEISKEFKGKFDNWLFGCDVCQDVCPWNIKFSQNSSCKEFEPFNKEIDHHEIKEMTETAFKEKFAESPVKRAKLSGLKRNSKFLHE